MSDTSIFRRQHAGLLKMGGEIVMAMQTPPSPETVRNVRMLVARFKGSLLVHQRMENEALYPRLFAHDDASVVESARALYLDLGDLYDGFLEFERKYAAPETAETSPQDYYKSVGRLLKRLMLRMQREDKELYALAQRADYGDVRPEASEPDPETLRADEERARWAKLLATVRPPA